MERSSKKDLVVTLTVLLVIVFIVTGVIITNKKTVASSTIATKPAVSSAESTATASDITPVATAETTVAQPAAAASPNTSGFKDGTYSATSRYSTPEDTESITVNVTLKDGIVTDTSSTASTLSRESKEYATAFVQNYKSLVVGKSIASIKLSRVSGSSLTSQGFNDAIAQIQTQAKV